MAGRIAPDGRPPQAPGVGKDAKRHDLEAPATPGVRNSDMQQGDRQRLEAAQQIAPRPKKGSPQGGGGSAAAAAGPMQVPDAIEFAGNRIGGQEFTPPGGSITAVDSHAWVPLLRTMALASNSGGNLAAALTDTLKAHQRQAVVSRGTLIDMNALDETVAGGF